MSTPVHVGDEPEWQDRQVATTPTEQVAGWVIIVPIKELSRAKSRLDPMSAVVESGGSGTDQAVWTTETREPPRGEFASCFAKDVLAATMDSTYVRATVFVTRDRLLSAELVALGATTLVEPPELAGDLNAILSYAQRVLLTQVPGADLAIVTADLATVTGATLRTVLNLAPANTVSFVADHGGSGTTIVMNRTAQPADTCFGSDSAHRHTEARFADLTTSADPRLRLDIDTAADLASASELGLGPHTSALVKRLSEQV